MSVASGVRLWNDAGDTFIDSKGKKWSSHFMVGADTCWSKVAKRYYSFSRHVEQCDYTCLGDENAGAASVIVLHADQLARYCCEECATTGVYCQLADRGMPYMSVGSGPIADCSKCGLPMDLSQPDVAYELMDQTEIRQPWLVSLAPHTAETVALVCHKCDGNLSSIAADEPNDDQLSCPDPRAIRAKAEPTG